MSYCALKAVKADGDVISVEEFRNASYITAIWDTLRLRYKTRASAGDTTKAVWRLQYSKDITDDEWWVLMFTLQYAIAPPKHLERLSQAFRRFKLYRDDLADHGERFAVSIQGHSDMRGIRGMALRLSSVLEDPWSVTDFMHVCPDCGGSISVDPEGTPVCCNEDCAEDELDNEPRRYNIDKDNKHWFIPTREEWLEREFEDK